ncbi:MAG: hypothetical protein ACRDQT_02125, partial [Gaiellaceae bacterium]
ADGEGLREPGDREVVADFLPERLPKRDLDQVDSDCVPHEVGHLTSRDACGDLDDRDAAVGRDDELRERNAVADPEPERARGVLCDSLGALALVIRSVGG